MQHPRRRQQQQQQSTMDWLWDRQQGGRGGMHGKFTQRFDFAAASTARFDPAVPASIIAWNPRRLQNMILAVGPSTPAVNACLAERQDDIDDEDSDGLHDMHDSSSSSDDDDDDDDSSDNNENVENDTVASQIMSNDDQESQVDDDEEDGDGASDPEDVMSDSAETASILSAVETTDTTLYRVPPPSQRSWAPLIKHESCINTASWLDVPWHLSVNSDTLATTVATWEAPTQLVTSGDDHMVKFWDVRHAMGSTSPVAGGWDVFTPFSTLNGPASTNMSTKGPSVKDGMPPGAVVPLASIASGHLGNVFHVTPVPSTPGLVLTCGADGQLRSCHVERQQSSSLVMRPMAPVADDDSDSDDYYMLHTGMAYSHQLLTAQTGLLCSDRGLFRFDLRIPPREQPRQPFKLTPNKRHGWRSYASRIKACAVWSPSLGTEEAKKSHLVDSNYIFAGGSGDEVHMFDLRLDSVGEGNSRVVERYRPRNLRNAENVSVCGLDVSKDGSELLVSYESDQIYTFPIFNQAASVAGPTLEEIDEWSDRYLDDPDEAVPHLAAYGAHLNRFTFLKSARYAGPNDEYICTGSDSGHAWIYKKSNGTVASLLSADTHVCNGVVPHPTLPIFITYGIDSTAKVWRATPPVEVESSDTSSHRQSVSLARPYQMSPVTKNFEQVQQRCGIFSDASTQMVVFPDYIPTTQEVLCAGRFMPNMLWAMAGGYEGAPRIGNALRTLPYLLRSNRYECCSAVKHDSEGPIEGPLEGLAQRLSRMRLQHQADQIGTLVTDNDHPYLWRIPDDASNEPPHAADSVPDFPSDWIMWDPVMNQNPQSVFPNFILSEHPTTEYREEAYAASLIPKSSSDAGPRELSRYPWLRDAGKGFGDDFWWPSPRRCDEMIESDSESDDQTAFSAEEIEYSRKLLYYTALLCKEGGNEALKEGQLEAAARRYDKAIQYCCVAFLTYEGSSEYVPHLTVGMSDRISMEVDDYTGRTSYVYTWCPLLRVWIGCHLNLALIFLKSDLLRLQSDARNQAERALDLLAPYTKEPGKVYCHDVLVREDEPETTYTEARKLQAKAYFRLGSAQFEMGDFISASKALEASMASTDGPIDPITKNRLNKAKSRSTPQKKRNRRRFEVALNNGNGRTAADS